VGAIYNGQYAKGIVHAVVWGILMSMADSGMASDMQPVFIMLTICFWFYMAFEAYHTARKRRMGEPVDEYSSILSFGGSHIINVPVTGIALILLGVLLLLHTLDWVVFEQVKKYWPVLLIVAGAYLLAGRLAGPPERERRHERR
jgi:hypothetical protein